MIVWYVCVYTMGEEDLNLNFWKSAHTSSHHDVYCVCVWETSCETFKILCVYVYMCIYNNVYIYVCLYIYDIMYVYVVYGWYKVPYSCLYIMYIYYIIYQYITLYLYIKKMKMWKNWENNGCGGYVWEYVCVCVVQYTQYTQ